MINSTKKTLLFLTFIFAFSFSSFASHIVGGDLTVRWISGNTFEVTMQFFRDASSLTAFDPDIRIGIYDKASNVQQQIVTISNPTITSVPLGDACYTPTLIIEKAVYKATVAIPNNANGYYLSYHRCCRNSAIVNVASPADEEGYVLYCEIPNPSIHNSTPTFNAIPDGFMCKSYLNSDNFTCTDADGDQLVYSFVTPLSCSATNICGISGTTPGPDPGVAPKPYGTITWAPGYSLANQLGDPAMAINATTGIITTTPPNNGLYVLCVKVEEYRAGIKIGEIRRDYQFQMLPCAPSNITTQGGNFSVCVGGNTTLTANNAGPGFTYSWAPGGQTTTSIVVSPTTGGTYNYTVTATKALCTLKTTYTVTTTSSPDVTTTSTKAVCGMANGTATANASGGISGAYSYSWMPGGQTTQTATGLSTGIYTVTVSNSGCTNASIDTATVTNASLSVTNSSTTAGCSLADGTATANASGGIGAYTYSWMPGGQTTQTAIGLSAGTYSVTVSNATCANMGTASVIITNAANPSLTASATPTGCTVTDGTAIAFASGGTLPYTYSWSSGHTTSAITGLAAGTYTIIITDSKSCTKTTTVTVTTAMPSVSATVSGTISCYGGNNGSLIANPSAGTPAYTYSWSSGQTAQTATGLVTGTYTVTVTDAKGCTKTASTFIGQPTILSNSTSVTNPSSCTTANGSAMTTPAGGTPAYSYVWSNGQSAPTATGLASGLYSILITDSRGCTTTNTIAVNAPGGPIATASITAHVSCRGGNEGIATVNPTGGTGAYTYSWNNGQTTQTAIGLAAGTHVATVTDASGCVYSAPPVIISQPSFSLTATPTVQTAISCNGGNDGAVSANATGGTPGYTYSWNNGQTAQITTGLSAGSYTVSIVDSKGCTTTHSVAITQPAIGLNATISAQTNVTCYGGNNGSATATPSCGAAPYIYAWSNGQAAATATGLAAGIYSVTVTDANTYSVTKSVTITQPVDLNNTTCIQINVSCNGGNNGSATVNPLGGTSPYTYSWTNAQTTKSITGLIPGPYSVTITDSKGCTATKSLTIDQPSALSSTHVQTNISCIGVNNGSATLYPSGGTSPYIYSWSNGQTNVVATGLPAGSYTVNITDSKGCTATNSVTITQPATTALTTSISVQTNVSCFGGNNGGLTSSTSGGTPAYTYSWSNGQTSASATGLTIGSYTVTATDTQGCTAKAATTITQPAALTNSVSVTHASSCTASDGSISSFTSGGTGPYSYAWSNGQTTTNATGLVQGTYSVTITDANNCTLTATATVNCPTGIDQSPEQNDFTIYPNPTNGKVEIRCTMYKVQGSNAEIIIYNFLGVNVYKSPITGHTSHIDLSSQPNGIYFIRIKADKRLGVIKKIVKQ